MRVHAEVLGAPGVEAVQANGGRAAAADHLHLAPARHPDAERLAHRLLGGETGREMLRREGARRAVGGLGAGEAPLGQARAPGERRREPVDLHHVDARRR